MNKYQQDVEDFHRACDLPVGEYIQTLSPERTELRRRLIKEESKEMRDELKRNNITGIIDGACDTIVVVLGTLVEMGVDLDPFWDEVHRTNMAKKDGPVREDGKKLKPEGWLPPDLKRVLKDQLTNEKETA